VPPTVFPRAKISLYPCTRYSATDPLVGHDADHFPGDLRPQLSLAGNNLLNQDAPTASRTPKIVSTFRRARQYSLMKGWKRWLCLQRQPGWTLPMTARACSPRPGPGISPLSSGSCANTNGWYSRPRCACWAIWKMRRANFLRACLMLRAGLVVSGAAASGPGFG
jgi:hypothetical protein